MITVSTNGRSTPWKTGGSCRSLMMPDRHQQHSRAHVEPARHEEVEIGLFELQLALLFEPLDDRVLDLELAHEPDAR